MHPCSLPCLRSTSSAMWVTVSAIVLLFPLLFSP
jgi:hypothetical protein